MGKSSHQNPYREGTKYHRIFGNFRKRASGVASVTRQQLIDEEVAAGSSVASATAAVGVVLSPSKESAEGDCRGNMSAQGHLYYVERKSSKESNRTLRYSLRWRETPLEPHTRSKSKADVIEIEAVVQEPVEALDETPAEEATEEATEA